MKKKKDKNTFLPPSSSTLPHTANDIEAMNTTTDLEKSSSAASLVTNDVVSESSGNHSSIRTEVDSLKTTEEINEAFDTSPASGLQFPLKLHCMLDDVESEGRDSIVSWDGEDGFKVHNKVSFMNEIVPRYFSHSKYKSFQRMLNMWGFERIRSGPRKGVYTHASFKRGEPSLCKQMTCHKIKKRHQHAELIANYSDSSSVDSSVSSHFTGRGGARRSRIESFEGKQFHLVDDDMSNTNFTLDEVEIPHNQNLCTPPQNPRSTHQDSPLPAILYQNEDDNDEFNMSFWFMSLWDKDNNS